MEALSGEISELLKKKPACKSYRTSVYYLSTRANTKDCVEGSLIEFKSQAVICYRARCNAGVTQPLLQFLSE